MTAIQQKYDTQRTVEIINLVFWKKDENVDVDLRIIISYRWCLIWWIWLNYIRKPSTKGKKRVNSKRKTGEDLAGYSATPVVRYSTGYSILLYFPHVTELKLRQCLEMLFWHYTFFKFLKQHKKVFLIFPAAWLMIVCFKCQKFKMYFRIP